MHVLTEELDRLLEEGEEEGEEEERRLTCSLRARAS